MRTAGSQGAAPVRSTAHIGPLRPPTYSEISLQMLWSADRPQALHKYVCTHRYDEIWGSMSQSMCTRDPASVQITYAMITRPSENPPRGAARRWRTTIRASHVSARNISCWRTKILGMQGFFGSSNYTVGLLTLPREMVIYWEAFGAHTSCLLLREGL